MENFDAVGGWRTEELKVPIDTTGVLPGGKKFNGPEELITILKGKKDQFLRSFSEKLMTYALGRGMESTDRCTIDKISKSLPGQKYRFSALVSEIVQSEAFRMRRSDGGI